MWAPHVLQRSESGRKRAVPSSSSSSSSSFCRKATHETGPPGVRVKVAATKIDRRRDKPLDEGRREEANYHTVLQQNNLGKEDGVS